MQSDEQLAKTNGETDLTIDEQLIKSNGAIYDINDPARLKNPLVELVNWIQNKFQPGSKKGSIFTLLNAAFGSGVVVLPYAMSQSGIGLGIIELIFCGILGYYSTFLLVRSGDIVKRYSYQQLASAAYGKPFEILVKYMFFINCLGSCIFNTIVINQLITKSLQILFSNSNIPSYLTDINSNFWPPVITIGIIFPLTLLRKLSSLRYFSLLCFFITLYIALIVFIEAFNTSICTFKSNIQELEYFLPQNISTSLPSVIFAFGCHPNVLDVFKELKKGSKQRMSSVLRFVMSIVFLTYIILGFFGYVTFANNISQLDSGNILYADYNNIIPITIAILLLGISVIFTMPLCVKPAKDALRDIIFPINWETQNLEEQSNQDPIFRHVLLVSIVTFSQMIIGMFLSSLTNAINFLGSFTAPLV